MTAVHRRPGIASAATLAGIVLTLGLAHLVAPEWSRAAGLDVWNAGAARADLAASLSRGDDLEARQRQVLDQIQASLGVVERLGAGRLTLAEAAAELDALNADRPGWADGLAFTYAEGPTPRHRVALYAIAKLERHHGGAAVWAARSARLEAEYRALPG